MFMFCLVFAVFCARLFMCALWSPAGGGGGGGWPLGSRLWCLLWVCHFPIGILGQVWYLIVSIPDLCNLITFLKRNIWVHNKALKSVAYKTLVRPQLEYTSTVWYSYTTTDVNKVEAVQRRAARWATRDCRYTSSVTAMLKDLNWGPLDQR